MIANLNIIVLGLGRFGSLWLRCIQKLGRVQAFDPLFDRETLPQSNNRAQLQKALLPNYKALDEALQDCDLVFFCVPISTIETSLQSLKAPLLRRLRRSLDSQTAGKPLWLMDTCSVKVQPMSCLRQMQDQLLEQLALQLPAASRRQAAFQILGLHPMFGPDSFHPDTIDSEFPLEDQRHNPLRLVLCPEEDQRCDADIQLWQQRFADLGFSPLVMTAHEHDLAAARTQGLTHLLGRVLEAFGVSESPIATVGYQALCQICEQTCNDSWQLFLDIQQQNGYTPLMRQEFQRALQTVYDALEEGTQS